MDDHGPLAKLLAALMASSDTTHAEYYIYYNSIYCPFLFVVLLRFKLVDFSFT
jgi:hypothetical protein